MPLTLFPFHYFVAIIFIQQIVPLHIPCHPFCSPFLAMIVVSIFPLISTPFFLSHLVFLLCFVLLWFHSSLFCPFVLFFSLVLPIPPFCPFFCLFLLSHWPMLLHLGLSCINFCTISLSHLPYIFCYLSSFILSPIVSLPCVLLSCSFSFLYSLVVLGTCLPNGNENRQDSKVSGKVHVPSPPYPFLCSGKINTSTCHCWRQRYLVCQWVALFCPTSVRSVEMLFAAQGLLFSSSSEKTRTSNHLQMSEKRQHFLFSYF